AASEESEIHLLNSAKASPHTTRALGMLSLAKRAAAKRAYLKESSIPRKLTSGCSCEAPARNNPFRLPTSTSSGTARPKRVAESHTGGRESVSSKCAERSSDGSILGSARRPMSQA